MLLCYKPGIQKANCFEVALEFANKAITYIEDERGAESFYLALLNRCELLIKLGNTHQAQFDYLRVKASKLIGLESELKRIANAFRSSTSTKLTKTEQRLIDVLGSRTVTRRDLIIELYGDKIDWFAAENRFKMLLSRLRKKDAELVTERGGLFKLGHKAQAGVSSKPLWQVS